MRVTINPLADRWTALVGALCLNAISGCAVNEPKPIQFDLREKAGKIDHLYFFDGTLYQAFGLMGDHLAAAVVIDKDIERRWRRERISMSFQPMSWRNALVSLAVYHKLKIEQTGAKTYLIHGGGTGHESRLLPD